MVIYGSRIVITAFTRGRHSSLSYSRLIQVISSYPKCLKFAWSLFSLFWRNKRGLTWSPCFLCIYVPSPNVARQSLAILSSHLSLGPPNGLFPPNFLTKCCTHFSSPLWNACTGIVLDLIILMAFVDEQTISYAHRHAFSPACRYFPFSCSNNFLRMK